MRFFDSHAHYYDARFAAESPGGAEALLPTLFDTDVSWIVNVGTSPETSRLAIAQALKYPKMVTAIGIHPTDGQTLADRETALREIEALICDPANRCVAIGEIGLDYHYPDTEKDVQMYFFERQMELAEKTGLPVVIHDRDAHGDTMDVILRHPGVRGVLHSFSGSAEMAKELMRRDFYVSFSGTLTFTNARKTVEAAAVVRPDRVLIETDCPYLAPHPLRGTLNHSGNLRYTNKKLAEILGLDEAACAALTEKNAKTFFGIPD